MTLSHLLQGSLLFNPVAYTAFLGTGTIALTLTGISMLRPYLPCLGSSNGGAAGAGAGGDGGGAYAPVAGSESAAGGISPISGRSGK